MLGSAVIVLRETLEAALVIGILLAAVGTMSGARRWIAFGVFGGLLGSALVAFSAEAIASAVDGVGQELFNAAVLFAAAIMLAWHQVWMASHGRQLAQELRAAGDRVSTGKSPLFALFGIVLLAVMREGAEVVLFLYGLAVGGTDNNGILFGAIIGLGLGIGLGLVTYFGLVRIPQHRLFAVTGWLLTLLAAGMIAQAIGFLTQAGYVPPLVDPLWDSSGWLPEHGALGQLLHVLAGYSDRPSAAQVIGFVLAVCGITALARWVKQRASHPKATSGTDRESKIAAVR